MAIYCPHMSCCLTDYFACYTVMQVHCDQPPGSIMWIPAGWVHETCGLDVYSVGMGALSFDGADEMPLKMSGCPDNNFGTEYQLDAAPFCQHEPCLSLPISEKPSH